MEDIHSARWEADLWSPRTATKTCAGRVRAAPRFPNLQPWENCYMATHLVCTADVQLLSHLLILPPVMFLHFLCWWNRLKVEKMLKKHLHLSLYPLFSSPFLFSTRLDSHDSTYSNENEAIGLLIDPCIIDRLGPLRIPLTSPSSPQTFVDVMMEPKFIHFLLSMFSMFFLFYTAML